MTKILTKTDLPKFIEKCVRNYSVYAPLKKGETSMFGMIDNPGQIELPECNTTMSVKDVFYPRSESLFSFDLKEKDIEIKDNEISAKNILLFFTRLCDAKAMTLFDKLFNWDSEDYIFKTRRDNAVVISLFCDKPGPLCFCNSVYKHNEIIIGTDILAYDSGDKYILQTLTKKGEEFAQGTSDLLKDASLEEGNSIEGKSMDKNVYESKTDLSDTVKTFSERFESKSWDEVSSTCVGCAICTYVCPTCYCFDIQDEKCGSKYCRMRIWDTCNMQEFTKMPAHQPRQLQKQRYRQRIMHKFNYFPLRFGEILCVGCGRCIRSCPVNIDLIEVLNKIKSG